MLKVVHQSGKTETSAFDGFFILKETDMNTAVGHFLQ